MEIQINVMWLAVAFLSGVLCGVLIGLRVLLNLMKATPHEMDSHSNGSAQ